MTLSDMVKNFITLRVSWLLPRETSNHFVKYLAADSKYWLPTSASAKAYTSKPNQNKANP